MLEMVKNTMQSSLELPSYKNPPINEVVCGMRFHASDKIKIPHIGILWEKFQDEYPLIQHAPPITSDKGELLIDIGTGLPLPRVWFVNESNDQLVQFQVDRFYFNWRRKKDVYPRFDHIIHNFDMVFIAIESFFKDFKLGKIEPIEFELSYINHIIEGQGWNTIDDIPNIISGFNLYQKKNDFLPMPDKVNWQIGFPLPEHQGSLRVSLKQAIRKEDKVPLLVLELKTIGISPSTSKKAIRDWFNLAHEWIVRGFTEITSPKIQKIWERER